MQETQNEQPIQDMATPSPMQGYVKVQPKKPGLAALLGILIVGAGHMYLGKWAKGIALLIVGIIISVVTGGIAAPFIWIISCIWAYTDAKKFNAAAGY